MEACREVSRAHTFTHQSMPAAQLQAGVPGHRASLGLKFSMMDPLMTLQVLAVLAYCWTAAHSSPKKGQLHVLHGDTTPTLCSATRCYPCHPMEKEQAGSPTAACAP